MRRNHLQALRTLIRMKLPFLQGGGSISPLATSSGVLVCAFLQVELSNYCGELLRFLSLSPTSFLSSSIGSKGKNL